MTSHIHPRSIGPALLIAALLTGNAYAEESAARTRPPATTPEQQNTPPHKPLDLRAPEITRLFTSEQLNRILAASLRDDIEGVEVEGERLRMPSATPDVWPAIAAPFWALFNPTEAWRIIAPIPPDQARRYRTGKFNAVDAYQLEPAGRNRDTLMPRAN